MSYQFPETPFVPLLRQQYLSHLTFVSREVPEGWTAYRHPEGALYFVHGELVSEYRISLLLYLNYDFVENVYGSEHMRRRDPGGYRVLQRLLVHGAEI